MQVLSGPFAGMRLTEEALREHAGPCLLGTYEAELHPWLERLLQRRYAQFIDVGSKYGYYAVGLARRDPSVPSVAFDIDPWARRATREVAAANGVKTLDVRGFATPGWFDRKLLTNALVFSDCEGFERELFPPMPRRLRTARRS
jgi:16S RNA G1207 methylase RsmC